MTKGGERVLGGSIDALVEGCGRVKAGIVSGRITFFSEEGKEILPSRKLTIPEGTIESLKPLLQEAFGLFGIEQSDGYWERLAQIAPLTPEKACKKLRKAGVDHREAARLVIENEPRVLEALSHGNVSNDAIESFISLVSAATLREYNK